MADMDDAAFHDYAIARRLTSGGTWALSASPRGGRGLFALKPLPPGSEVFREPALLLGPRADPRCPPICVACHRPGPLRACSRGCGLPVCAVLCEGPKGHRECDLLQRLPLGPGHGAGGQLGKGGGLGDRLALVAPLRAVFLSSVERKVLNVLEGHSRPDHDKLLSRLEGLLTADDRSLVQTCCQVLDATAFETPCSGGGSMRGIYPAAAMMNHDCVPNTRHCFDASGCMVVETTRAVTRGEELTTSYTCLTWGTQARRAHLLATKRFVCRCRRCDDPAEFGARLMALYCMRRGCGGSLLPGEGGGTQLPWSCVACNVKVPALRVAVIQKMVQGVIAGLDGGNPKEACRVLCKDTLVPGSNHVAVQFRLSLVNLYGNQQHFTWSDLSLDDLALKHLLCTELILLFSLLGLGLCTQRGYLLLELLGTLRELKKRREDGQTAGTLMEVAPYNSAGVIYAEAEAILRNDASAAFALQHARGALVT